MELLPDLQVGDPGIGLRIMELDHHASVWMDVQDEPAGMGPAPAKASGLLPSGHCLKAFLRKNPVGLHSHARINLFCCHLSHSRMNALRDQFRRPLHDLRISVIDQCNFRCPYCMPAEIFGLDYSFLPRKEMLTDDEVVRLAGLFLRAGVRKLRLTGGEPLLRRNLPELLSRLSSLPGAEDLSLTTNGWLLSRLAVDLARSGLHRINVSLDSLDPVTFGQMNGRGHGPDQVIEGIDAAAAAGLQVKVNMVVQMGVNHQDILPMARFFRKRALTLRFIEFMDVGNCNQWSLKQVLPALEIVERISAEHPLEPLDPNYRGEVASRYRYQGTTTEIGLIASVTEPFCRDCHRARLSADGKLFTCLFATRGTDFRARMRSGATDEELWTLLDQTWNIRHDRYSEERFEAGAKARKKVEMSYIGG